MSYSLWKKLLCLFALGFCNQVLLDLHYWWSEELCSQHLPQVGEWVTYWDSCKGVSHVLGSVHQKRWRSYIGEFKGSKAVEGFWCKFIYGIIESRDKGFVLDLKLLFTIMDCFSGRFPPRFFTAKLVCFIGFLGSSYLVLFIFPLHDFDMILMFVCFNKFYS